MNDMIRLENICKSFRRGKTTVDVLKGVSLSIVPHEFIGIVGASGAGKSTLLHIIGTLDTPTTGSVSYQGTAVNGWNDRDLCQFRNTHIGFVFQFHYLIHEFSALENVMMPGRMAGLDHAMIRGRAEKNLAQMGLGHRLHHRPSELSGGEQQRVAIARALLMQPKVLFADEPTGNLDTHTGSLIYDLLLELNEKKGLTVIMVTHNPDLMKRMKRVVRLEDGVCKDV